MQGHDEMIRKTIRKQKTKESIDALETCPHGFIRHIHTDCTVRLYFYGVGGSVMDSSCLQASHTDLNNCHGNNL